MGKLPIDSSQLNSNVDFSYDLSENNVDKNSFYNNTKLPDELGSEIDYADCSKDYKVVTINTNKVALQKLDENNHKDTMETIRSIIWRQSIQDSELYNSEDNFINNFTWWSYHDSMEKDEISKMKREIESSPIQIAMNCEGGGHAVVGETIYQDINDSSIYYLGIYDSNYPENEEYIRVKKNYYFYNKIYNLEFNAERSGHQKYNEFTTVNIDKILELEE